MQQTRAAIADALSLDDGLRPATVAVGLYYDADGYYVPEIMARHSYGWAGLGIFREEAATNAALPAVARARQWADELGIDCRE